MDTKVCKKCGAELLEGQEFCVKCGTPVVSKPTCTKCGAELSEGQEFCPKCGQKVDLAVDSNVSSAISQFNAGVGEKKKKKSKRIILAVAIPVVLIVIGVVVFSLISGSFKGKYVYVSGESSSTYTFEDDYYIYKTSDDNERGKYKVEKDQITLTDSDGEDEVWYRDGKLIFDSDIHYDTKINDGEHINQELKRTVSTKYDGYTLTIEQVLTLKDDGSYEYVMEMTYIGVTVGDKYEESGNYTRDGNKLVLSPKGESYTETYCIRDGFVYTNVFMKQK